MTQNTVQERCKIDFQANPNNISATPRTNDEVYPCKALSIIKEEVLNHPDITVKREDLKNMEILGQFNQGFILCILRKNEERFLITVDQHAADEIFNFEKLQRSFVLKKQTLIIPIKLDISPLQELLIEENLSVFDKNGFTIKDMQIFTLPVYKNITFTLEDFYSLLENVSNEIYESNKFRDIMASKACRSSIMIGKPLGMKDMKRILANLSTLKFPWNCPHGRPTFKIITKL